MSTTQGNEIVREVKGNTLSNVLDYISSKQVLVNRTPVTIFTSVLESKFIENIDIPAYLKGQKDLVVHKETLERTAEDIFIGISDSKKSRANSNLLMQQSDKYLTRNVDETDDEFAVRMISKYFNEAENLETLYARDLVVAPNDVILLETKSSCIHPEHGVQLVEGVNTSMWYVGGAGSSTSYHVEDGDFASMNLLLKGEEKIWGFVPTSQLDTLKEKIKDYLNAEKDCAIFHKPGLLINPELLKKWNIQFAIRIQKPGDLMYVGEGVMHFVINNGLNLAEAINFGTKSSTIKSEITKCSCENVNRLWRQDFVASFLPEQKVETSKQLTSCEEENCKETFLYVENYKKHLLASHGKYSYVCEIGNCTKKFQSKQSLHRHVVVNHEKKIKTIICQYCNKTILKKNELRHVNEQHREQIKSMCPKCKIEILQRNLSAHVAKCEGEIKCVHCGKVFKTKQGRSSHRCVTK